MEEFSSNILEKRKKSERSCFAKIILQAVNIVISQNEFDLTVEKFDGKSVPH